MEIFFITSVVVIMLVKLTLHIFLRNHIFQPSIGVSFHGDNLQYLSGSYHASKADSKHISEKSYLSTKHRCSGGLPSAYKYLGMRKIHLSPSRMDKNSGVLIV